MWTGERKRKKKREKQIKEERYILHIIIIIIIIICHNPFFLNVGGISILDRDLVASEYNFPPHRAI